MTNRHKVRRAVLALGVLLVHGLAAGEEVSRLSLFPPQDAIYDDLRFLAVESGSPALSFTPPLSSDEIRLFLDGIDPEALAPAALDAYRRVEARLTPSIRWGAGALALSVSLIAQVRAGLRSDGALAWELLDREGPGFLRLPVDLYFGGTVQLHFEPAVQPFPDYADGAAIFGANVPSSFPWDSAMPFRAFAAAGGTFWKIQAGRDRLSFGGAHTGNLLIGDAPLYHDFARVSFFAPVLTYSALVSHLPLSLDAASVDPAVVNLAERPGLLTASTDRYLYVHRLDLRVGARFTLALTEGLLVGNTPLQLRYLNPLMIMHDFFSGYDNPAWGDETDDVGLMDNSIFSLEFTWNPAASWSVYGQVVIDELQGPWDAPDEDDPSPNGLGYLLGVEASRSLGGWGALFFCELVYTDPYLYVDNSPFAALIWYHGMVGNNDNDAVVRWLGYPEGRDLLKVALGARFNRGGGLVLEAGLAYTVHGAHGLLWDWRTGHNAAAERAPSGTPEHRAAASLTARWRALPALTLSGGAAVVALVHGGQRGTEAGVEVTCGITWVW